MQIILLVVFILAIYLAVYYFRIKKAIAKSVSAVDQTGVFRLGDKSKPSINVLMIGDSIAASTGVDKFEDSIGGRLAKKLSEKYYVFLSNKAKLGNQVIDLAEQKITGTWDLVILITGSNEMIHRLDSKKFGDSLDKILKELSTNYKHVVLVGPGDVASSRIFPMFVRWFFRRKQRTVVRLMNASAAANHVLYINPLERNNSHDFFSTDGFHPNALGYKLWFEIIWEKLRIKYG